MSNKMPKADAEKIESGRSLQIKLILASSVLVLVIGFLLYSLYPTFRPDCLKKPRSIRCIAELEYAKDEVSRSKGLSGRDGIGIRDGMLFVFDEPAEQCFWMKDMKFNIDIIWLDADKKVVKILENASPSSYPEQFCSDNFAKYVVELHAGQAVANGVSVGQRLSFRVE